MPVRDLVTLNDVHTVQAQTATFLEPLKVSGNLQVGAVNVATQNTPIQHYYFSYGASDICLHYLLILFFYLLSLSLVFTYKLKVRCTDVMHVDSHLVQRLSVSAWFFVCMTTNIVDRKYCHGEK